MELKLAGGGAVVSVFSTDLLQAQTRSWLTPRQDWGVWYRGLMVDPWVHQLCNCNYDQGKGH